MSLWVLFIQVLSISIVISHGQFHPQSPCPGIFSYEGTEPEQDRWYGVILVSTDEALVGVRLDIRFDRAAQLLVSWTGDVTTTDNERFTILSLTQKLLPGPPLSSRFMVKYEPSKGSPQLRSIRLNGRQICPPDPNFPITSHNEQTPRPEKSTRRPDPVFGSGFEDKKPEVSEGGYRPQITTKNPSYDQRPLATTVISPSYPGVDNKPPRDYQNSGNNNGKYETTTKRNTRPTQTQLPPVMVETDYNSAGGRPRPPSSVDTDYNGRPRPPSQDNTNTYNQFGDNKNNYNGYNNNNSEDKKSPPSKKSTVNNNNNYGSSSSFSSGSSQSDKTHSNGGSGSSGYDNDITYNQQRPSGSTSNQNQPTPNTSHNSNNNNSPKYTNSNQKTTTSTTMRTSSADNNKNNNKKQSSGSQKQDTSSSLPNPIKNSNSDYNLNRPNYNRPQTPPTITSSGGHYNSNSGNVERQQCGVVDEQLSSSFAIPLITNGQRTARGQWPWHIALYKIEGINLSYICGGTLVSLDIVVTAAHCVTKKSLDRPVDPDTLVVYLGKYHLYQFSDDGGVQNKQVRDVHVYPGYNSSNFLGDIAVLILSSPAEYTGYVRPCCLWKFGNSLIGKEGTVVGWGYDENDKVTEELKMAKMPVVSRDTCILSYPEFFTRFTSDRTFCAGFRRGTTVCNGDSGGGMVFNNDSKWYLKGLVSITVAREGGTRVCDTSHFVVFTDVAEYSNWLSQYLNR